jgi:mannosylglucosylglycerate synthase
VKFIIYIILFSTFFCKIHTHSDRTELLKNAPSSPKKIGIIHYRVGRTDGVSLEIEKRKNILESLGHTVKLISGPVQNGANFIIDELEFEHPDILQIKENCFEFFGKKNLKPQELIKKIFTVSKIIEHEFLEYQKQENFDLLLIHNIFSLGLHIAAASAFYNVIQKLNIPTIATHHDYYWERKEFQKPTNKLIRTYLELYVPPKNKNIHHVCINSLAQKELKKRKGIDSSVFPDVFDFHQQQWQVDDYNADFLEQINVQPNDLIILQATRIVNRKGIEIAIQFVKELEKQKKQIEGKRLYNGKVITKDSQIIFVIAGFTEKFAQPYLQKLKQEISNTGIKVKFIYDIIDAERKICNNRKIYSLWDAYVFADIITYPSLFEGWGNQFLEAVFAKKPVVLFEYPVFKTDIKKEGYSIISLGSTVEKEDDNGLVAINKNKLQEAVLKSIHVLTSSETLNSMGKNFNIGLQYHSYDVLRKFLINRIGQTKDS